jgi:hypothetical protein
MHIPVITPIVNASITRNPGVTAKKNNKAIIKQISTAKNAVTIINFFIFHRIIYFKEPRYKLLIYLAKDN